MEFFNKAKCVRLKSHLGKYLVADDDEQTVRQSRNSASALRARWTVELVETSAHLVRLKSCHGYYLTASDEPFLLGMTGKKVTQSSPMSKMDVSILWEPIKDGEFVRLRTKSGGKFLRANGGTPPWRNSLTHDFPHRTATQDWVLWEVDIVDIMAVKELDSSSSSSSIQSNFSNFDSKFSSFDSKFSSFDSKFSSFDSKFSDPNELEDDSLTTALMTLSSRSSQDLARETGMELFSKAKFVRLRSHHDKFLLAEDDEESVCQDRNGSCKNAKWTVEFVEGACALRFKSCFGKYLTATNVPCVLRMTGKKVTQTMPRKLDPSVQWEPIREGFQVRLKTQYGDFLRANGGVPPWRNSITHDIPHRTTTQDWILWDVDIVETRPTTTPTTTNKIMKPISTPKEPISPQIRSMKSPTLSKLESNDSFDGPPMKHEGRIIYYFVADEDVNESIEETSFNFKGKGVEDLKNKLKEETGLDEDIVVCSRNPLNGKLYPLKLHLPPNNTTMHVVLLPSSSKAAAIIATQEVS